MHFLRHSSLRAGAWALVSMLAIATTWLSLSGVKLAWSDVIGLARAVFIAAACIVLLKLVRWRLRDDAARTAACFSRAAETGELVIASLIVLMIASCLTVISSYAAASLGLPLQDARLAAIDVAIGFDWLRLLGAINELPLLGRALTLLYHSTVSQIVLVVLILAMTGRTRDLAEFCSAFCITSLAVVVLSGLLPAEGAYLLHKPEPRLYANLSATPGTWHLHDLYALREGRFDLFSFRRIEGIITFPSFHTVLAILTVYAVRSIKPVFVVAAIANSLVILSTLPEGGHYLIDLLAGAVIVAAAIAVVRRLEDSAASRSLSPDSARPLAVPA